MWIRIVQSTLDHLSLASTGRLSLLCCLSDITPILIGCLDMIQFLAEVLCLGESCTSKICKLNRELDVHGGLPDVMVFLTLPHHTPALCSVNGVL